MKNIDNHPEIILVTPSYLEHCTCYCLLGSAPLTELSLLTLLHSEQPKLHSFGCSECNRVK